MKFRVVQNLEEETKMIGVVGTVIGIVAVIILIILFASESKKDILDKILFLASMFGLLTVSYAWGTGNPDSLSDNTLYQIENDPFNSTVQLNGNPYEHLIITATPVTLSSNGTVVTFIKKEEEPKYYSVNKRDKKIEQFKKGDIVLNTKNAIVIFKISEKS